MVCRECGAYNAEHLTHCRVCAAKLRDDTAPSTSESEARGQDRPQRGFAKAPAWPSRPYAGNIEKPVYQPPEPEKQPAPAEAKVPEPSQEPEVKTYERSKETVSAPRPERPWEREQPVRAEQPVRVEQTKETVEEQPRQTAQETFSETRRWERTPELSGTKEKQYDRPTPQKRREARCAADASYTEKQEQSKKRYCSVCSREMLPDAPYCAYCGSHEGLPGMQADEPSPTRRIPKVAGNRRTVSDDKQEENEQIDTPVRKTAKKPSRPTAKRDFDTEDDVPDSGKKNAAKRKKDMDFDDDDDFIDTPKKPVKAKKAARKVDAELDYEDELGDEFDEDGEDFAPRPKGTTFLFWILIAALVLLIGVFGGYIVKKNFGGDIGNFLASITGKPVEKQPEDTEELVDPGISMGSIDESKMYTAEIGTDINPATGETDYLIDIYAPTGSTVKLEASTQLNNGGMVDIQRDNHVTLKVPRAALLPNVPLETPMITIKPKITVINPEGNMIEIDVPPVTSDAEQLELTILSPEGGVVQNTYDNAPIHIKGQVKDHTVEVSVGGKVVQVQAEGLFETDYTPSGNQEGESITIEARSNNCMSAVETIRIEPFVIQPASLAITNDVTVKKMELTANESGKVTIKGTTIPGATITATSTDATVAFDTATVTETGEFTLNATLSQPGVYPVSLKATAEGYTDAEAECTLEMQPTEKSSNFRKAATSLKKEQHASIVAGTTSTGSYAFTGTITSILTSEPYEEVKMTISTGEEIIVTNRSAKNRLEADDLNKKKTVAGTLVGTKDGLPHLWVWFVWNA